MIRAARPAFSAALPAALRHLAAVSGIVLGLSVLGLGIVGCGEPPEKTVAAPAREAVAGNDKSVQASPRPVRDLDSASVRNFSLLLAGMVPAAERAALDPVWRRHAEAMDALWREIEPQLRAMDAWAGDAMPGLAASPAPVFHPFAGPDPSSALVLFPEATSYLLVGREAPGRLPMPESLAPGSPALEVLDGDLERLRAAFATRAATGAFSRSEVAKAVTGSSFDGVLPALLALLVRGGALPLQIDYVSIDAETLQIHELPDDQHVARAMRIVFADVGTEALLAGPGATDEAVLDEAVGDARQRIVYYFARELSNSGLFPHDPLHRLIAAQPMLHVYMKSSEYLPHLREYSTFRELVLERADAVLQDDSGLPLRSFTSDLWSVGLYGRYEEPTAVFHKFFQEELAAAFARGSAAELPFRFGYRSSDEGGCLILARRQQDESASTG
ncbi:MAG: hypothetical protein AAGC60_29660 [Acidobacteriota bacterium]